VGCAVGAFEGTGHCEGSVLSLEKPLSPVRHGG
jgi:hypothetical protein